MGLIALLIAIGQDLGGIRTLAFSITDQVRPDATNGRIIYGREKTGTSQLYGILAGSGTSFLKTSTGSLP